MQSQSITLFVHQPLEELLSKWNSNGLFAEKEIFVLEGYEKVYNSQGVEYISRIEMYGPKSFACIDGVYLVRASDPEKTLYKLVFDPQVQQIGYIPRTQGFRYFPPLQNLDMERSMVSGFDVRLGQRITADLIQQTEEWIRVEEHSHRGGKVIYLK